MRSITVWCYVGYIDGIDIVILFFSHEHQLRGQRRDKLIIFFCLPFLDKIVSGQLGLMKRIMRSGLYITITNMLSFMWLVFIKAHGFARLSQAFTIVTTGCVVRIASSSPACQRVLNAMVARNDDLYSCIYQRGRSM